MGGGSKSPPKPDTSPKIADNNGGVPDAPERRGLPIRDKSNPAGQSLLAPTEDERKSGNLY